MDVVQNGAFETPYLDEGRSTIESLPVVELGVEGAGRRVVMELDQSGMILAQYLSDQHAIGEVPGEVAFGSAEGETINPLEQLFHLVLVDRGCLHQRTIIATYP